MTPAELLGFEELFNYTVTPFSGEWMYTEPQAGNRDYADLDAYVAWCDQHHVRVELKFVAGYQPAWVKDLGTKEQTKAIVARAQDLMVRYGGRIDSWEVADERIGIEAAATVFSELRKLAPKARLGIGDDARFWSPRVGPARQDDMLRGRA